MKLSEMSSKQAFECMARMVPFVAAIERDPDVAAAKQRMIDKGKDDANMGDVIENSLPVILERHMDAVFGIIGAMEGKTPEEIAEQPYGATIEAIKGDFTRDFFDFLPFASRLVMNA